MLGRTDECRLAVGLLGHDDLGAATGHVDAHRPPDESPTMSEHGRRRGPGATGFGDTGAALPHEEIERVGFGSRTDELDVHPGVELRLEP